MLIELNNCLLNEWNYFLSLFPFWSLESLTCMIYNQN